MEDNIRDFYGWIAAILTILVFLIPVKPFIELYKGKINFENSPVFLVTVSYVNCICWYIYGDLIFSRPIKYCNLLGIIFNFIFISFYLYHEIRINSIDAFLNGLIIIVGTYALKRGLASIIEDEEVVGNICMWTHFVVLLSPLILIITVLRQKNYNSISIYFILIFLTSTINWIVYGVDLHDTNIIYPNIAGLILSIVLVIIYKIYGGKYKNINDLENNNTIEIEANEKKQKKVIEGTNDIKIDAGHKNKKIFPKSVEIVNSKAEKIN